MSEETTTTESTETAAPAADNGGGGGQRPVFLTVLCILSFIAAGFGILGYITLIGAMGVAEAGMGMAEDAVTDMGGTVTSTGPGTGMIWAYLVVGFLTVIVSLIGVIQMWKLKKKGFMLYTGASVVSIIMGIIAYGFTNIVGILISVAFIVMYYLNTKHMS